MKEINEKLFSKDDLDILLKNNKAFILKGRSRNVGVGQGMLIKVNTNIGVSNIECFEFEKAKLEVLSKIAYRPDTIMDHTIVKLERPFWKLILENFDGPVGTLPHYLTYKPYFGFDKNELLDNLTEMAESGVSFMTLHPTPTRELFDLAKKTRSMPTTSRGGGLIIDDMIRNNRATNIIEENFSEILNILKNNNLAISIGTTFRPSNIFEAMDKVHIEETILQLQYVKIAKEKGVKVMMEGIGHITLDKIQSYADLISNELVPFMPLGPIPTDVSIGFDHVASAIGATNLALIGLAKIINSVTAEEHTGNVPTLNSIIEGLKAARVAAHIANISLFPDYRKIDLEISKARALNRSCITNMGLFSDHGNDAIQPGCDRCKQECPLNIINN